MTPVSSLVILCRPAQWREAAIVLSCCPPGAFTPLLVIEPPPVDDDGYRALFDAYVAIRNQRSALSGTIMALQSASDAERAAADAATDDAARALGPFRSWWRHQQGIADLLARRPPRRALLLFDPAPGELDLIDAIPSSRIGPTRVDVLPPHTERISLDPTLATLPARAWSACGRDTPCPPAHGPAADTPLGWFAALARALPSGQVIAADAPAADPTTADSDEAVLVEVEPDATSLIGVQYAAHRRARLVLTPAPDTAAVKHALSTMSGSSHAKLFGALRTWWQALNESPDIAGPLQAIEDAVNAAVPDQVVDAVGDRDLTAFTRDIPYSFVRKRGADWTTKTIGHVAGDPVLIILTELLNEPSARSIDFSLLFDTGDFSTSETTDVLRVLHDRPAIPLLLSNDAAAELNLIRLAARLPVEFLHFNTHGTQREIVLKDGLLPAWKLVRQGLPSRPFVFNNSCLSWVGVGREFIRAGARGYIGTLWPVDAEQAARLAATVLERITRQGWPIARAIRETGVDRHTDRAYLFAGTATAGLATIQDNKSRRGALSTSIRQLLGTLLASLAQGDSGRAARFIDPMQNLLWSSASDLTRVLDAGWPEPDRGRLDIALDRLSIMASRAAGASDQPAERAAEIAAATDLLGRAGLPQAEHDEVAGDIHYQAGRIALAEGRTDDAIGWVEGAVSARALSLLSDALRVKGRIAEALAAAEAALVRVDPGDKTGGLLVRGRIGQLSRMMGKHERALAMAREGYAIAVELDNVKERATFKGDETRALLVMRRAQEAVEAARLYRNLARQAFGELEDLGAAGALVQALTMAMSWTEADTVAQQAYAHAIAMKQPFRAAQFLIDRARIASSDGRLADGVDLCFEAATGFAGCSAMDRVRAALGLATEFLNTAHSKRIPPWKAMFVRAIQAQTALLPQVTPDLQAAIAQQGTAQIATLRADGG